MTAPTPCPLCDKPLNVPADSDGRRFRCPGCSESLRIRMPEDPEGAPLLVGLCEGCGAEREAQDAFCPGCGAALGVQEVSDIEVPKKSARRKSNYTERRHEKSVRKASNWVLAVAVILALAGTVIGMIGRSEGQAALAEFAMEPAETLMLLDDGTELTVGELRSAIESEVLFIFVVNYGIALIMLACWFWSKRSALPALTTALGVYVTMIAIEGVVDPASIFRGILIKALVISALLSGVRAALAQRSASEKA